MWYKKRSGELEIYKQQWRKLETNSTGGNHLWILEETRYGTNSSGATRFGKKSTGKKIDGK
jgi:hypothetical protein